MGASKVCCWTYSDEGRAGPSNAWPRRLRADKRLGLAATEYVDEHIFPSAHACENQRGPMPYPREHRDQTRARIVRSARTLFNRRGFEGVKIDDIMAHAGLTRGGFYNYFETKGQLYAEAVTLSLAETPWARWDGVTVDFSAEDAAKQVIHAYLSQQHLDDVDGSCPMVALPSDVARSE